MNMRERERERQTRNERELVDDVRLVGRLVAFYCVVIIIIIIVIIKMSITVNDERRILLPVSPDEMYSPRSKEIRRRRIQPTGESETNCF